MKFANARIFFPILSVVLMLVLASLACNLPSASSSPTVVTVAMTQPSVLNISTPIPSSTNYPIPTITSTLALSPTSTEIPATFTPSQTATITHLNHPGTPAAYGINIWDRDSSVTAAQHRPQGGDYYNINLFERPFNANTQDTYFPQVDIQKTSMQNGTPWIYGSITLKGTDPSTNQLDASYALELDLNLDGRGDVLIVTNQPAQGDWSTNGVQVFEDPDHDVGGNYPLQVEALPQGNGYEQKVFDSGQGTDPDLAWSRVDPAQPNVVWFAFKPALLNNSYKWMWGAWTQMGGLHPELFDYNDHFTLAQAGNPYPGNPNYPIKALAELDNTCRWAIGFSPTGNEPGLCPLPATATPQPTSTKSRTSTPKPTHTKTLIPPPK